MTLCYPMDGSLPGSSVHGIFQARVLEWVAISFSRGSSPPRDRTQVFHIASRCFTLWATREATYTLFFIFSSIMVYHGWGDLGEWHWNMYNIMYETSRQSRFDARYWMLGAGALGWPRGRVWGGRREEGSRWGTHVYLWWTHFDIWQN